MSKQTLKQVAYQEIKEKILNCEYEPNSFLNEDFLCEELGMSRTPVRDALSRLEQERLVSILPKKGFFVSPVSQKEINMVFEGRLLLEPYFLLNYCADMPADVISRMKDISAQYHRAIESNEKKDYYRLDNEFHQCIVSQCTNIYLIRTYEDLQNQDRRLRIMTGSSIEERLLITIQEHKQILDCIIAGDLEGAAEAMRKHLGNSKSSTARIM
ncbi:MAG TPA: GntR family transcriptional regulator [Candidatus Pelethocola excrementipullorum]|nr:GntR family transcriptional regulator [Candidatus Pelethocola excrementipullorum]